MLNKVCAIFKATRYYKPAIIGYLINELIIREVGKRDSRSSDVAIAGWAHWVNIWFVGSTTDVGRRDAVMTKEYLRKCTAYLNKNTCTRKFLRIQRIITRRSKRGLTENSHFGFSDADGRDFRMRFEKSS